MQLISCKRVFDNAFVIGFGAGRGKSDKSVCVFFLLGFWILTVGLHVPPNAELSGGGAPSA